MSKSSFEWWRPGSIAGKLIFSLVLIALVPCLILSFVNDRTFSQSTYEAELQNLRVVHADRTAKLEGYTRERIQSAMMLARSPFVISASTHLVDRVMADVGRTGLTMTDESIRAQLVEMADSVGANDVLLLSPEGGIMFSALETIDWEIESQNEALTLIIENVTLLFAPEISQFTHFDSLSRAQAFVGFRSRHRFRSRHKSTRRST